MAARSRRLFWWCIGVVLTACMAIASFGLSQPAAPACEDQLAMAQKLIQVLKAERDRAQEGLGQIWSVAERYEKAQKAKAAEEKKDEAK